MKAALFLVCALALPRADPRADYMLLKEYIESRWPDYWVAFTGENVQMLNAKDTFIVTVDPVTYAYKLHVWMIRRAS